MGCGKETHIKEFREVTGYTGKILTDPSRESFQILGFTSSIGGLLGLKTISRGLSAFRQGIKPGSLQGNALQLGGAIVVDSDSSIRYLYRSSDAGDEPSVGKLLESLP